MRRYVALVDSWQKLRDREDFRFGLIAATIINAEGGWKEPGAAADSPGTAATPADFFPNLPKPRKARPRAQSAEEMLAVMRTHSKDYRIESPAPENETLE